MKPIPSFAAFVAALFPASVLAQSPSTPGAGSIVVTGTRSEPVRADLIGGSVTVLDAVALERRQTRTVSDILRDVPGVAVSRVAGQTQVRLRGAEGNHTLVLVDGIEVSDPFAGEFDFGTLGTDEGARVEVLRGPQSAIYGSDAIGGVIQYLTASGRETPGYRARVEGGSFGTLNAAARLGGVSGALDYALTATFASTDGTPNARGGERELGEVAGAAALKSTVSLSADARLTAVARYSRTEADFNDSDFDPAGPTFGLIVDSPGVRFENEAIYGLLRGELDLLDTRWTHALSGQIADTERNGFDPRGRSFGNQGQRLKGSYETSFRLDTGAIRHRATLAVDVERERYRNTDPSGFAFTGRRQSDNVGIVGQYEGYLGERAALGASVRRDVNDPFDDATSYRLQASYKLDTGTRLRAAAGSGIKNPGFYELFGFIDGRFIGNPDLRPERSQGWEAGIEQDLAQGRVLVGATYFRSRLKDEIFTTFPPPDFVATPDNRDTTSKQFGVETFLQARLGTAWRVDASYTFLDATEDGAEEVRRPDHVASVAVDWRAPGDRGGLTVVARYNGSQRDLAFTDPSFVPVRVTLDDYVLLNLNGDVGLTDRIELFGRVENLLDEEYEEVFSFTTPGRTAYAGLRARF